MRLRIERPSGQLTRTGRTEIAVRYGVVVSDLRTAEEGVPGSADVIVWLPLPGSGIGQSDIRFMEPLAPVGDPRGVVRPVRFEGAETGFAATTNRTVVANRYGLSLEIDPSRVSPVYEGQSGFFSHYTRATPEIPSGHEGILAVAADLRRGRSSPYAIARAAYDWVLGHLDGTTYAHDRSALAGLTQAYGDDYTYTMLFVTILRAARIPARPVGGVLAGGRGDVYAHFWAEFFVPGIGWVPTDPFLGDGGFPARFPEPDNPSDYYFGNLDSFRLAFYHGHSENGPGNRDGVHVTPADPFTSQRSFVEYGAEVAELNVSWLSPRLLSSRMWSESGF
jgi:hypothetical protein